jgi:ribosomal protein S18 acetylase RimI-like enzyme
LARALLMMFAMMNTDQILIEEQIAVGTIVAAFEDDPAARWLYPDDEEYRAHFPEFVRLFGGRAFETGTADMIADGEAAALWLPPGVQPDEEALGALVATTVHPQRRPAVFALLEQMGVHHPHEPHWYLPLIGVAPQSQGRGLGSELLRTALRRCDGDGLAAYLEATDPRNVRLYERHGFRVVGRIQAGDSPETFPMLRSAN